MAIGKKSISLDIQLVTISTSSLDYINFGYFIIASLNRHLKTRLCGAPYFLAGLVAKRL